MTDTAAHPPRPRAPHASADAGSPAGWRWASWRVIALVVVIVAAAAILPFVWAGVTNPYVELPPLDGGIDQIVAALKTLDKSYAGIISAERLFKDISSDAALVVGAAVVAAGVLRAPQLATVMLGALAALLYGTQTLFYSPATITTLTTARGELACIEIATRGLVAANHVAAMELPQLQSDADNLPGSLQMQSVQLGTYLTELKYVTDLDTTERMSAAHRINALASNALPVNARALSALQSTEQDLRDADNEIWQLPNDQATRFPGDLRQQLTSLQTQITDAENELKHSQLSTELDDTPSAYLRAAAQAAGDETRAGQLMTASSKAIADVPAAIKQVATFEIDVGRATAAASNAVSLVHGDAMRAIAAAEPTPAAIHNLIVTATATFGGRDTSRLFDTGSAPASAIFSPAGGAAPPPTPAASPAAPSTSATSLDNAVAHAKKAIAAASQTLANAADALNAARQADATLKAQAQPDLDLLAASTRLLSQADARVETAITGLGSAVDRANTDYQTVNSLTGGVDFNELQTNLQTCAANPAQSSPAPTSQGTSLTPTRLPAAPHK